MFNSELYDIISIVLILCFEFSTIADFVNTVWRLFFDIKLSTVLAKLERIHEQLIRTNIVRPIKIKIHWILIVGIFLHIIGNVSRQIKFMIFPLKLFGIIDMVIINQLITITQI